MVFAELASDFAMLFAEQELRTVSQDSFATAHSQSPEVSSWRSFFTRSAAVVVEVGSLPWDRRDIRDLVAFYGPCRACVHWFVLLFYWCLQCFFLLFCGYGFWHLVIFFTMPGPPWRWGVYLGAVDLGSLASLVIHGWFARRLRLQIPPIAPTQSRPTQFPICLVCTWLTVAFLILCAWRSNLLIEACCSSYTGCFSYLLHVMGMSIIDLVPGVVVVAFPHLATVLLLRRDMERLEAMLLEAETEEECRTFLRNVELVDERWRLFLHIHFLIDGVVLLTGILGQLVISPFGFLADRISMEEDFLPNLILMDLIGLLLQVESLAQFNSLVLRLQRSSTSATKREVLYCQETAIMFSVYGVRVTYAKIRGIAFSVALGLAKSLWRPLLHFLRGR